jgi:hypothetical protein
MISDVIISITCRRGFLYGELESGLTKDGPMKRARFTERRIGERNVMPMRPPIPPPPIPSPAPRPPPSPPPACAHARPPRRFPAPWRVRGTPGGYAVQDASGFVVVHVYGNDRPKGRDNSTTKEEPSASRPGSRGCQSC